MKILTAMLVALALSLAAALAQDQSNQSGGQTSQGSQSQTNTSTGSGQNMSGTVSHDRKRVTNDKDGKSYKVDNPETLKGNEDQHVALVVAIDPDTNVVHIIQVEQPPQQ
jgi:Flp pilus assembly protein TadD